MNQLSRAILQPVRIAADVLKLPVVIANPFATRRVPLHAPDFPLLLLFTEKAGCTSLTKWFLFHVGKLEQAAEFHHSVHRYRQQVLQAQPRYGWEALRLLVSRDKPVLKLVRNPYDRAVSSFLQTLNSARDNGPKVWGRQLVAAARRHAGKPEAITPTLSFRDFVQYLAMIGTARGQVNGHVARQHLASEDGRIDHIIKLEHFAVQIRQIEAKYALAPSPLEQVTSSLHHRSRFQHQPASEGCVADLELTPPQVRNSSVPAYEAFYDDDVRRLVRACFAADFKAYGYDP